MKKLSVFNFFILLASMPLLSQAQGLHSNESAPSHSVTNSDPNAAPANLPHKVPCTLEMQIKLGVSLEQLSDHFFKLCSSEGSAEKGTKVDLKRKVTDDSGALFDCQTEFHRVMSIKKDYDEMQKTKLCPEKCAACEVKDDGLEKLLGSLNKDQNKPCTETEKQQRTAAKCLLSAGQAMIGFTPLAALNSHQGCMTELVNGVVQDVLSNAEGFLQLATWAYHGAKDTVVNTWKDLWTVEDKTSDALHMAASKEDSFLKRFVKNPKQVTIALTEGIWSFINESIKNNFGCEKWSGRPHFSECTQPMRNWSCASCAQMTQAVCGVGGFLGGEIVSSFLTGMVIGKAATAAKLAKVAMAQNLANKTPEMLKAMEKLTELGSTASALASAKYLKLINSRIGKKFSESLGPAYEAAAEAERLHAESLAKLQRSAGKLIEENFNRAANSQAAKAVTPAILASAKVVKLAGTPLVEYFKLVNQAQKCGLEAGKKEWFIWPEASGP